MVSGVPNEPCVAQVRKQCTVTYYVALRILNQRCCQVDVWNGQSLYASRHASVDWGLGSSCFPCLSHYIHLAAENLATDNLNSGSIGIQIVPLMSLGFAKDQEVLSSNRGL